MEFSVILVANELIIILLLEQQLACGLLVSGLSGFFDEARQLPWLFRLGLNVSIDLFHNSFDLVGRQFFRCKVWLSQFLSNLSQFDSPHCGLVGEAKDSCGHSLSVRQMVKQQLNVWFHIIVLIRYQGLPDYFSELAKVHEVWVLVLIIPSLNIGRHGLHQFNIYVLARVGLCFRCFLAASEEVADCVAVQGTGYVASDRVEQAARLTFSCGIPKIVGTIQNTCLIHKFVLWSDQHLLHGNWDSIKESQVLDDLVVAESKGLADCWLVGTNDFSPKFIHELVALFLLVQAKVVLMQALLRLKLGIRSNQLLQGLKPCKHSAVGCCTWPGARGETLIDFLFH